MGLSLINNGRVYRYDIDENYHCLILVNTGKNCHKPRLYDKDENEVYSKIDKKAVYSNYKIITEKSHGRHILNKGLKKLYDEISYETHPELYTINNRFKIHFVNFIYGMDFKDLRPTEKFIKLYHKRSSTYDYYYKHINNKECYEFMKNNKWAIQAFCAWALRVGKFFTLLESRKYSKLINSIDYFYSNGFAKFDAVYYNRNRPGEKKEQAKELVYPSRYGFKLKIEELKKFINQEKCELPSLNYEANGYNKNAEDLNPRLGQIDKYTDDYIKRKFKKVLNTIILGKIDYTNRWYNENINRLYKICQQDEKLKKRYLNHLLLLKLEGL